MRLQVNLYLLDWPTIAAAVILLGVVVFCTLPLW
jgi:hypothetical protein